MTEADQARLRELLERVTEALGLSAARVEVTEDDEVLTGVVHADDLGLFIGRHGQTIDAVQHLAQRILPAGRSRNACYQTLLPLRNRR